MKILKLLAVLAALFTTIALPLGAAADPGDPAGPPNLAWINDYTMFVTSATTNDEMYAAKAAVDAAGGRVSVIIPYRVMLGWIAPEKAASLVGKGGITAVYQKPTGSLPAGLGAKELDGVKHFNAVASGAWAAGKLKAAATAKQGLVLPDNREAPAISYDDVVKNLEGKGLSVEKLAEQGIVLSRNADGSLQGAGATNSAYMAGLVVFNAMFIESIGKSSTGVGDLNSYTWTAAAHTTIMGEIISGLNFWATQAGGAAFKVPLTFVYADWYGYPQARTNYEPIKHSSGQDYLWINQIMANCGFTTGTGSSAKFARAAAFNAWARSYYNTNWSVLSFIGYNPTGAPSTFTDGYFAYTWNTYTQLLYRNDGWGVSQYDIVNAHETGHIFGASDEYYQPGYGGCTSCAPASNGVLNGNCEYCNQSAGACMMRGNSLQLCGYTPGQVGWTNVRSASVATADYAGKAKFFFAPGEKLQGRISFCVAGPRWGARTQAVRVRFVQRSFGGSLYGGTPVSSDSGWVNVGSIPLPTTTGSGCWVAWANLRVSGLVSWGPASLDGMVEVAEVGRGHASMTSKFYVTGGADRTEDGAPLAAQSLFESDEPVEGGIVAK